MSSRISILLLLVLFSTLGQLVYGDVTGGCTNAACEYVEDLAATCQDTPSEQTEDQGNTCL